jgi:hypothetical protein
MPRLTIPAAAPSWLAPFATQIERLFAFAVPSSPVSMGRFTSASLPIAPNATGCLAYRTDAGALALSNGSEWQSLAVQGLYGSATYNPGSLANQATVSTTVAVPGAFLGQYASAALSVSNAGLIVQAHVTAAGVVTVSYSNLTGSPQAIGAHTLHVRVTS